MCTFNSTDLILFMCNTLYIKFPSPFMHGFFSHFAVTRKDPFFHFGVSFENEWKRTERWVAAERTVNAQWALFEQWARTDRNGERTVNARQNGNVERFRDCSLDIGLNFILYKIIHFSFFFSLKFDFIFFFFYLSEKIICSWYFIGFFIIS